MHPIILSLGPIQIHSYGLSVAVGVFLSILYLRRYAHVLNLTPDTITDLALVTVLAGFIGARIFYVVQFWEYFRSSMWDILKLWEGGLVFYGGLVGGFAGFAAFIRLHRLSFRKLLDFFMPALILAQGFGRIGCFLNGCCYGVKTGAAWCVRFPFLSDCVHPTQLYEAFFCFSLFIFLFLMWQKRETIGTGKVTFLYFLLYPAGRFFIEYLRGDNARLLLNLTIAQWISLSVIVVSVTVFTIMSLYGRKTVHRPS